MNELERINKNLKIKASQLETKKRRKTQSCSVYKVKIDESSLNKKQREVLKMIFVESKWIYNDLLNHLQQKKSLDSYNTKKEKELNEDTKYLDEIGIDFGIKTTLTTSTGFKYNVLIEESERIKKLQRSLNRKQKRSNNQYKLKLKLAKAYEKLSNQKNDQANKIIHELLKHKKVYMQDEQLHSWHQTKFCSKKIQHSILGRVKLKLMHHERVIVLKKNVATTQYCPNCQTKNKLELNQRLYSCSCGYSLDRDVHAASNMIILAQDSKNILVRRGPTELTLAEIRKESLKQEDHGFISRD